MSNEYKDWLRDAMQDEMLEQGLVDIITEVYPKDNPCYIEGVKGDEVVNYYVNLTPEGWLCQKLTTKPFDFN